MEEITIDNSILESVAICTTQVVMRYVWHLSPPEEAAPAFNGKCGHEALAHFFISGGDVEGALSVFEQLYRKFSDENVLPDDRLSWENTRDILEAWMTKRPIEKLPFVPIAELIEKGYSAELAPGITFFGLVDMPTREKITNALYPCDHKFTGNITAWWLKKFRLSSQMTGYMWLTAQKFGEPVPAFYINAIEIKKLPRSNRKCPTHKQPYIECTQNIHQRFEHIKCELKVGGRTPEVMERWKAEAIYYAKKFGLIRQMFPDYDYLPAIPMEGMFNNGCTFCDFREFCAMARPANQLETMFVKEKWAPWEREDE